MTFPSNPSNGDTYIRYGRTYQYDSAMSMWKVLKSGIQLTELSDIDITTITPVTGDALVWSGTKFEPDNINLLSVYQSELPLSGNVSGQMAYVTDTSRLYIYTGAGWFNVALVNTNPTITVGPDGSYAFATDGTPIVLTLEAQDPEELPIAWSYTVTSGTLGSTASVSQADNVFTITPSTNAEDAGEFSITFTASDGVNLATAVSSFTLAFGIADQYYNKNSLLLKSGSAAGLNNNTFVDGSTNGFTVTQGGDVYQGSLSPYSPAGWSAYFDGTGDYLTIPSSTQFEYGTGDFTFEFWIYVPQAVPNHYVIDHGSNGGTIAIADNKLRYYNSTTGTASPLYTTGVTITYKTWHHIALTRSSGTTRLFIDGVLGSSGNDGHNYGATTVTIGNYGSQGYSLNGTLSNLRLIKGTALYTSNFTPPTEPLTAISGTSLLTCQSNRFIDNSTNNFTITRYGDTKPIPFSPYLPSEKYDPTIHGGSAYFDGTDDSLRITSPSTDIINWYSSDYTIEYWINGSSFVTGANGTTYNNSIIVGNMNQDAASEIYWGFGPMSGGTVTLYYYNGSAQQVVSYLTISTNIWNHLAMVQSGGTIKIFINGVQGASASVAGTPQINAGYPFTIGRASGQSLTGYISDLRITRAAVYTSNFTPPTQRLTAISGTSLLLNMNNAGIYDEISKNNIKLVGDVTTSTTQTKYNDTAIYFDGTSDALSTNLEGSSNEDFTVEGWIYSMPKATPTAPQGVFTFTSVSTPGSTTGNCLYIRDATRLDLYSGGYLIIANEAVPQNAWFHLAMTRASGLIRVFVNGTQVGSVSASFAAGPQLDIGVQGGLYFYGYMSDIRMTRGVARYTANFTPPTAPLGFSNEE